MLYDHATELGFRGAVLHVGSNASEPELHQIHSPKALHLATHGFVLPEMDTPKAAEQDVRLNEMLGFKPARPNPMLRCGLALAGAQRTLETWGKSGAIPSDNDGVLTAAEIGGLDLRGTRLVVLSACDTGTGEARAGEGVLGLRRGFVQAGAENLLLTLWPIDDAKTVGLIYDFYTEGAKKESFAFALARVQRRWLQRLSREYGVAEACRLAGPYILSFQGKLCSPTIANE
jgi:hypothetical protein